MAAMPDKNHKRYRGRLRAVMRSAYHHCNMLYGHHLDWLQGPSYKYPNQLAPEADILALTTMIATFRNWLEAKGPIPDRDASAEDTIEAGLQLQRSTRPRRRRGVQR